MSGYEARFKVWRGDARGGGLEDFTVEVDGGEVVLDVIHRLQATQVPDPAVRWNCEAGKCGSCSAEINGRPRLMCMTRMSVFTPEETITVTPLRTFPVIRDLVTDVGYNYAKALQLRQGPRDPLLRPAVRPRSPASTACSRRTWTVRRSSASASSASCARTCAMSSATTRTTSGRTPARAS
ncbi:hypothetical protein GCM10009564_52000 [Streptomyces thermogriseus]|uniref:2Fe-2S ferredoxin-type domain-containing protein n=1 Tax=Streptomyces thermogriseus TaxID=75292 RepID=A0ABP4DRX1_9ACTN